MHQQWHVVRSGHRKGVCEDQREDGGNAYVCRRGGKSDHHPSHQHHPCACSNQALCGRLAAHCLCCVRSQLFEHPRGTGGVFVMEHLDMSSCGSMQAQLGTDLGRLHQHNIGLLRACSAAESRITGKSPSERGGGGDGGNGSGAEGHDDVAVSGVEQFGFECTTCCGFLPQDNTWCASWPEFYARSRLQTQMDMLAENHGDREALQLWSEAQLKIDSFFRDVEVKPSLIHGDLWGGNVGQTATSPVVFDPASCYGHHEFDLGIGVMFGSFSPAFHNAYHKVVPKSPNFDKRTDLYQLFHHLNHWNHFGSGYRGSSISLLRSVAKGL
ncbi:ketosamine-3-kinase-like isoform X2 [Sycon ciliatum]|uniref:ketosamine-3-kinase-like isoform X2 n=1 Tax=Sycon ciliatum TaxID=27933 RepID=UPI0031F65593